MSLHVNNFGGGIVVEGSVDTQRTDEVQVADDVDIGPRGALVVTTTPSDYLELLDQPGNPWSQLWALLECGGFNFSKVFAVGEGDPGTGTTRYIFSAFNREGESSPLAFVVGSVFPPASGGFVVSAEGVRVLGAEFAGIFWIRFGTAGVAVSGDPAGGRFYFVNIGAREGQAPTSAPGLFAVGVVPPSTAPSPNEIIRFDALGTGEAGSLGVPTDYKDGEGGANFGSSARQLHFRGIIAYNNHLFGWGYDTADDRWSKISGITNANPGVVTTSAAHGYKTGDIARIRGVDGMSQVNGQSFTITVTGATTFSIGVNTTAYGAYIAGAKDFAMVGNGDGPNRVMFSNLGRPLRWGNDKGTSGTDRAFVDSDAIVLGDAGEIIRHAIVWSGKLIFGTNKGLHYIAGYGRDSFLTDGANPIMRSFNVIGGNLIEGPDKCLYGVGDQGLWCLTELGGIPKPLFDQLRDYSGRSTGYWDLIWTDVTRAATYPGTTNQDLVWTAVDWDRMQVVIGIPWCSIANGYGYGTDTVILKYHVRNGGFTRQQFAGVQYTAAGYFRAQAQQAAMKFLGTPTSGEAQVKRYGFNQALAYSPRDTDVPASAVVKLGPYAPFGADGRGVARRMYLVFSVEGALTVLGFQNISGITNANPAEVTTSVPHNLNTGDLVEIYSVRNNQSMKEIVGGPYTITRTGSLTFTLDGIDSTLFGAYVAGGNSLRWLQPIVFACEYNVDENTVMPPGGASTTTAEFMLSLQASYPEEPSEGDLWADLSLDDPNIGNATAGAITQAQPGYLMRMRTDNSPRLITGATRADPCVITAPAHGYTTGDRVSIREVIGMTELNNNAAPGPFLKDYTIVVVDVDHFSLVGVDSSGFSAYSSGGRVFKAWWQIPRALGGIGATGLTIPIPVPRKPGTRVTLNLDCEVLGRRWQLEGFGINPGDGGAAE